MVASWRYWKDTLMYIKCTVLGTTTLEDHFRRHVLPRGAGTCLRESDGSGLFYAAAVIKRILHRRDSVIYTLESLDTTVALEEHTCVSSSYKCLRTKLAPLVARVCAVTRQPLCVACSCDICKLIIVKRVYSSRAATRDACSPRVRDDEPGRRVLCRSHLRI